MTNHPNRSTSRPAIVVTRNKDGEVFPNLAGVFRRVFPIVVGQVRNSGNPGWVNYYDESYTISLAESE